MQVNSCQHCCNNFARSTCFSHREREQATTPRYAGSAAAASVRTSSPKLFRIGVRGKSRFAAVPRAAASATASASSSCRVVRWHARAPRSFTTVPEHRHCVAPGKHSGRPLFQVRRSTPFVKVSHAITRPHEQHVVLVEALFRVRNAAVSITSPIYACYDL